MVSGLVFGVLVVILSGIYWGRIHSIVKQQRQALQAPYYDSRIIAYDVGCGEPFSSPQEAADMEVVLTGNSCDFNCRSQGSRWSHAFALNATVCLLLITNFICICLGSHDAKWRLCTSISACCLCCGHIGVLVATGVYRFRL